MRVTDEFQDTISMGQYHFHAHNTLEFNRLRNKANRDRKKLKKTHVSATMAGVKKTNPRKWWQNITEIVGLKKD